MTPSERSGVVLNKTQKDENDRLSPREKEVLCWAMEGKTNWETSVILSLSERTVKFHIRNAMVKLRASSRAHAVALALRRGLIPCDLDGLGLSCGFSAEVELQSTCLSGQGRGPSEGR